jgi:hypothetical protein
MKEWDSPDDVWSPEYWLEVFSSISGSLLESAAIVVFADCVKVLPKLLAGVDLYNEHASDIQRSTLSAPVQICFNKLNHPHKGPGGYSQSVEHAFLFYFGSPPKITRLDFELAGNLLSSTRVTGARRILDRKGEWMNPAQKPNIWLKFFLDNHAKSESVVMDLTAGSFSSFLACYYSDKHLHWVGCDIGQQTLDNWDFLLDEVENETKPILQFSEGNIFCFLFY